MSSIILVRHGPVALKAPGLLSFADSCRYIDAYERAGIEPEARPPEGLVRLLGAARTIFASDAERVAETLTRLGVAPSVVDANFREAPPLAPRLALPLPANGWLALARLRGEFDPGLAEAREDLRRRAERCCEQIMETTRDGDAALVGHGWFNHYVARALARRGWRRTDGPGFRRPWGYAVFQ